MAPVLQRQLGHLINLVALDRSCWNVPDWHGGPWSVLILMCDRACQARSHGGAAGFGFVGATEARPQVGVAVASWACNRTST